MTTLTKSVGHHFAQTSSDACGVCAGGNAGDAPKAESKEGLPWAEG